MSQNTENIMMPSNQSDDAWFAEKRKELSSRTLDTTHHYRLLVIGGKTNGETDINACLERALRNLGHHVLFLDTAKHRPVISNKKMKIGGFGPNNINIDYLSDCVGYFRPDIAIFLGGGLALTQRDAEWFRNKGVITIGVTLSDPDVFDTVAEFCENFDFHTTNSLTALRRYRDHGIRNTLHFPFGVDRSFVTQDVPKRSEFAADVICLGHANGHPIRNEVMSKIHQAIGSQYSVRAYGIGWNLDGSRVVGGTELLQASRGGLIHVNFPMTRAGYTNVKCGVFESVAAGAILATMRFEEMESFFDYGEQILGYSDPHELPSLLADVLSQPDRKQAMRRSAFARLTEEHLYEHRWNRLFDEIREIAAGPKAPGIGQGAELANEVLGRDRGCARLFALSGFYGARNVGDDLLMRSIVRGIESNVESSQVLVVAQSPNTVERSHGLQAVSRANHHEVDHWLSNCEALVIGGGGLWHDYTFREAGGLAALFTGARKSIPGVATAAMMAHVRDIPVVNFGLGVGPLTQPDAKQMVKFLTESAAQTVVRDEKSKQLLVDAGVREDRVDVAPDLAYGLPLDVADLPMEESPRKKLHLAINLRPWSGGGDDSNQLAVKVGSAIVKLAKNTDGDIRVVLLPMQEGENVDRKVLRQLKDIIRDWVEVVEIPSPLDLQSVLAAIANSDVLLSMRLHANLLAHRLGVPAVGLAYDPKVTQHFQELGRKPYALPLTSTDEQICDAISAVIAAEQETLQAKVDASTRHAHQAMRSMISHLQNAPHRGRTWSIMEKPPAYEALDGEAGREPMTAEWHANRRRLLISMLLADAQEALKGTRTEDAIDILAQVRKIDKENSHAISMLMQIYADREDWTKLTYYVDKAKKTDGLDQAALIHQAFMYIRQNRSGRLNRLLEEEELTDESIEEIRRLRTQPDGLD